MPRIFSPDENYNSTQGYVDFVNGAAVLAASETAAIAFFNAEGYTVDAAKDYLTPFDTLTLEQIQDICDYAGISWDAHDSKYTVIRKLEVGMDSGMTSALTVTSTKGAQAGKSTIAVSKGAAAAGNVYKYKIADAAAPKLYYGDKADSTWTTIATGTELTDLTTGHKLGLVECLADGSFVYGYGSVTIDATPGD